MTRVLLHAGFHKTGTKSVQQFLRGHGDIVWRRAAYLQPARMREIARLAFWYADDPGPAGLALIRAETETLIGGLSLTHAATGRPTRDLIISAENLCGPMPRGVGERFYPHAPAIIGAVVQGLAGAIPTLSGVTVYLSRRPRDAWIDSVHAHHLRRTEGPRMTMDRAEFATSMPAIDLADEAQAITAAIPDTHVLGHDITALADARFGIAQPFVDFLRLPDAALAKLGPVPHLHRAADAQVNDQLLALNRGGLDDAALAAAKAALLDTAGQARAAG